MNMRCRIDHIDADTETDEYGNVTYVSTQTFVRCYLAQNSRREIEGTPVERDRWSLYLPPGVHLDGNDNVTIDETTYQVLGDPWLVIEPVTRRPSHIEATLQRGQ